MGGPGSDSADSYWTTVDTDRVIYRRTDTVNTWGWCAARHGRSGLGHGVACSQAAGSGVIDGALAPARSPERDQRIARFVPS